MRFFAHRSLLFVALLILVSTSAWSTAFQGTLEFSESKIQQGSSFTVKYRPGLLLNGKEGLFLSVYAYNHTKLFPTAFSFALSKSGKRYEAEVSGLPSDAVFLLMKVGTEYRTDWNNNTMWEAVLYNGNSPARGAEYCRAFSYLGSPIPNVIRPVENANALQYLEAELKSHPGDLATLITAESIRLDRSELTKEEYTTRIEELVRNGLDSTQEHQVRIVSRALRTIGRPADATDLVRRFIAKNSNCDLAEEDARAACFAAETREDFEERVKKYVSGIGYNVYSDRMYMDLINSYLQQGAGDEVLRLIRAYPVPPGVRSHPPASILNMIAVSLLKQDSLLPLARQYAERALRSAESAGEQRPRFFTEKEFAYGRKEIEAIVHDTYGCILMQLQKPAEASDEFQKSIEIMGAGATKDMLEHCASALIAAGKRTEALEITRLAISTARSFPQSIQRFQELAPGDAASRNRELASLQEASRDERLIQLKLSMMQYDIQNLSFTMGDSRNVQINDFSFKRMDGSPVSLKDLRGKVVVIDFWATWCGPCRMAMPYMQKIYEMYQGNSDVQIILANVWERTSDTTEAQRLESRKGIVKKFLEQNPTYTFPMMIDVNDQIVGCFGVTGIPTKFYIDRNGVVQFKEVGLAGPDAFVDEAREKIELLLSDTE
ncbi:MAG: redoxin domain-containing protein [Candidatus Kapaibacterium sp.]